MIELTDDGTMDTVLRCSECGEEMRYNFTESPEMDSAEVNDADAYDEFIERAIEDATESHDCFNAEREEE